MKKISSLLATAAVALLSLQASAYSVTFNIDNPAAVKSVTVYADYEQTVVLNAFSPAPSLTINYEATTTVTPRLVVEANPDYVFTKLVSFKYYNSTIFQDSYKDSCNVSLGAQQDGYAYTLTTANFAAMCTNAATVIVNGNASKVALSFSGTYRGLRLSEGTNTVRFMDQERTFTIGNARYGEDIYSVSLNGVLQSKPYEWSMNWDINVSNGDTIVIEADYPAAACDVYFVFAEDGTEDYVTRVVLNNEDITGWESGSVEANVGDNIEIFVDPDKYKLNDFQVNYVSASFNSYTNSYTTKLEEDEVEFYFDVEPWGTCTATVTVDNPERLLYRIGHSGEYSPVGNKKKFTVSVPEKEAPNKPVYFTAADDSFCIVSIVAGEYTISPNPDGSYSTQVVDGQQIQIATGLNLLDKTAYFYFHNPDDASAGDLHGSYFRSSKKSYTLTQGYNEIVFGDADNPFEFGVNGEKEAVVPMVWFYRNGERKSPNNGTTWQLSYADNDVFKVYVSAEEPEPIDVFFFVDQSLPERPDVVVDYVVPVDPQESDPINPLEDGEETPDYNNYYCNVLPGTRVTLKPNGMLISVDVNFEEVLADEDGNYSFFVTDPDGVAVEVKRSSALGTIEAAGEAAADTRVFNLQGIEMTGRQLPAGLYIQNGRKFIVR